MPTYDYECNGDAHHRFEQFQRFSDPPVAECPECGAPVRRVIHATGVIFKGPGFYKTDNAPKSTASDDAPPAETPKSSDADATGTTETTEKPAAPAAADA